jgi:hypothetical protein
MTRFSTNLLSVDAADVAVVDGQTWHASPLSHRFQVVSKELSQNPTKALGSRMERGHAGSRWTASIQ